MCKKMIFLLALLLCLGGDGQTLNPIDKFIVNHGVSACNGEGPDCEDFIFRAEQTKSYKEPITPEIEF